MPRHHSIISFAAHGLLALVGCQSDPTVVELDSTGSGEVGGAEAGEGTADTTSADGTGGDECALPAGGYFAAQNEGVLVPDGPDGEALELGLDPGLDPEDPDAPEEPENWGLWAPGRLCADLNPVDTEQPAAVAPRMQFRIHRPQTAAGTTPGTWPEGRFPVLVFFHGNGANAALYDHIFRPLVEDGFIVVNVNVFEVDDTVFATEHATAGMACAVRYVTQQDAWPDFERSGCGVSLAGHSRGAQAAVLAMGPIVEDGLAEITALVAIGGLYELAGSVPANFTVPLLVLSSASDEDVRDDPITLYDRWGEESPAAGAPKVILRAYDVPHLAFGGSDSFPTSLQQLTRSGLDLSDYLAKGHAIAANYTRAFLRRHVLERDVAEYEALFTLRNFPPEIVEPSWWDYLVAYDELPGGFACATRDEASCVSAQGCVWDAPDCESQVCAGLGQLACDEARGCAWDGSACQNQPVITGAWSDPTLPTAARAVVDDFEGAVPFDTNLSGPGLDDDHQLGTVVMLAGGSCEPPVGEPMACTSLDTRSFFSQGHDTNALRLAADGTTDGYVRWSLEGMPGQPVGPLDATGFTSARMRVGVRSELLGEAINTSTAGNCALVDDVAWSVGMQLGSQDAGERRVDLRPLVQQEAIWSLAGASATPVPVCAAHSFMETIEVPLRELCAAPGAAPFGIDRLDEFSILLPADNGPGQVVLDSIELVAEPGREQDACQAQSGRFACEVGEGLEITREACATAPGSGVCPSPAVVQTPQSPPAVSGAWGGPFDGWVVHVPAGWVDDVADPTVGELALVASLCERACTLHYADDPHVTATCDAVDAFETPTLLTVDSAGSIPRIPSAYEDGSGLSPYGPESLSCSLESDCCEAFAEDVCRAAPQRPTPAAYPLGQGEQWVVSVTGELFAKSLDELDPVSASLIGTVGYSQCADGNAEQACPFYLGSVHLELIESLELEAQCDDQPVSLVVDAVTIDLEQPAMGIAFEDSDLKAFPPGALRLRGHVEAGPLEFDHLESNLDPVYFEGGAGWFLTQGAGGFVVAFGVPCNGTTAVVYAWVGFEADAVLEHPPSISIAMPSTTTCGATEPLALGSAADPDDDLASLRWEIDGVLLGDAVDEAEINGPHELRAILRDERGATAVATHSIACTPP